MKKIFLLLGLLCGLGAVQAQDTQDLASKIVIAPYIGIKSNVPNYANSLLLDKMKQVLLKNGLSDATDRTRYLMTVQSNIVEKEITTTAPVMTSMTVEFTFYIGDVASGLLFSSRSFKRKAVGENEEKAYRMAIKNLKVTDPEFKLLVDKAKTRIIESLDAREEKVDLTENQYNINWW